MAISCCQRQNPSNRNRAIRYIFFSQSFPKAIKKDAATIPIAKTVETNITLPKFETLVKLLNQHL
jgi:hypothetical protein